MPLIHRPELMNTPQKTIKERFENALSALQAQSSAAAAMLPGPKQAKDAQNRAQLKTAQARMRECEPETGRIWKFVMSGAAGKTLPELTIDDLAPLMGAANA